MYHSLSASGGVHQFKSFVNILPTLFGEVRYYLQFWVNVIIQRDVFS